MKRALLISLLVFGGCDFEKAFGTCVMEGTCEGPPGVADSGTDAGLDAGTDAGIDAGQDAGSPDGGTGDAGTLGTAQICNPHGWCWQTPTPRVALMAVVAGGPNEAWAFGFEGVAMYFDGRSWRGLPGRSDHFKTAARFGPRQFLVGAPTGLFVLDGETWRATSVTGDVTAVGVDPSGELFATTTFGASWFHSLDRGVNWSVMTGPGKGYAFSFGAPGRGWASGEQGKMFMRSDAGWVTQSTTTQEEIISTWASSADDAWAGTTNGTLLHFRDGGWSEVDAGLAGWVTGASRSVNDGWILSNSELLTHWDGTSLSSGIGATALGALALGESDGWAVGDFGSVLHLEGLDSWLDTPTGSRWSLNSVHGTAADDIWAVGAHGITTHFDGTAWTEVNVPSGPLDFFGVFAAASDDVWAVGEQGVVLHWTGSTWEDLTSAGNPLYSVFVDEQRNAWIVGLDAFRIASTTAGVIDHDAGFGGRLNDVSGAGDTVFIVGESGAMVSCNVTTVFCNPMPAPADGGLALSSVHAAASDDVWVTARNGRVFHWNGSTWVQRGTLPSGFANKVRGGPDGGVFAVGNGGDVTYFSPVVSSAQLPGTDNNLYGVFSIGGTTVLGGDVGTLLKKTQ